MTHSHRQDIEFLRDSLLFSATWYTSRYPDVSLSGVDPLEHYVRVGAILGRDPHPLFSAPHYEAQLRDRGLVAANPLIHYLREGWRLRVAPHPLFPVAWYFQRYPDIAAAGVEPVGHFLIQGVSENRQPHPCFCVADVLDRCPELRRQGINPLVYYLEGQWTEDPCPEATRFLASTTATRGLHTDEASSPPIPLDPAAPTTTVSTDIRAIAFYLPQFHTIPENDEWWGPGFTEWTNVRRGAPQYRGHYQPHVPHPDLGYYDLDDPEVMEKQAALAREAGLEGFCFYYYWFNGRRLLERPIERLLATGRPDFPFCFCWANENWTRTWDGSENEVLMGQHHSPESDARFIRDLLPAFRDRRYIRVDGRPLLLVYRPGILPDFASTAERWRQICRKEGIGEIYLAGVRSFLDMTTEASGLDALVQFPPLLTDTPNLAGNPQLGVPASFSGFIFDYRRLVDISLSHLAADRKLLPGICPSWDNTARRLERGTSWVNSSPETYERWLRRLVVHARANLPAAERFIFINAWNEWAEGCHLEPDEKFGYAWIKATRAALPSTADPTDLQESQNPTVHPVVDAVRESRLRSLTGSEEASKRAGFLADYTALLAIFRQKGHAISVTNGLPVCRTEKDTFTLEKRGEVERLSTAIWGDIEERPFCFVLLQYNKWEHTQKCVESIRKLSAQRGPVHIIIVDNASSGEAVAKTRELFGQDEDVSLIFNSENLGFAAGNNAGYRHAREKFGDAFIVVMNNDVVIEQADFADKCRQLFRHWSYSILGPDIVTPDRRRENPWNDYVYGLDGWKELRDLFLRQKETFLNSGSATFERSGERSPQKEWIANPILQGACYIFSPIFVHCHDTPFDESSFLYGEEFPLAVNSLITGHFTLYSSELAILHEEGVSTGLVVDQRKMLHGYDGALNGIELSLLRLQRQADAADGKPLGMDEAELAKLTSDGRRHVLVDLFFCQPGFHGGGEYGKAVFRGLIEASTRLPDVQLWAALDPDLFIDEWVWEECRRNAINIVRVKSYDHIVALVNPGYFHSFFAPAIVVYTGYEYMKRIGGNLKFDEQTSTRVIGTLLDLRDFEMASEWETIAEARRKAGCRPETDHSAEEWREEALRQGKHARDLAEMYRRICTSKALETIVTISDYSAQSIRKNAGGDRNVEVLFAPEKNRTEPEAFAHRDIDFENEPYLVLLNAGRVEKNAAAAVAAMDSLFADPAFTGSNPRLKLVLVGIDNIHDLGIGMPREHRRIAAIPHLSPPHLEYLIQKSQGLLYPSFNEGFGYPPLEAMSLGIPSVVSNRCSIPEVCGAAASYCDPFDIGSVASAIRSLLSESLDAGRLKAHAATIKRRQNEDLHKLSQLVCGGARPNPPPAKRPRPQRNRNRASTGLVLERDGWCPICDAEVTFSSKDAWLRDHYLCSGCGSIPRERAIMHAIQTRFPDWRNLRVHESSSGNRGASVKLREQCRHYVGTQYDPTLGFGRTHPTGGYRSEDLEKQTFADEEFDLVVTQDVMEHILDAEAAFREIHRTLKPGGIHVFTTPLINEDKPSLRRAERGPDGNVIHHFPPEFHANPMSGEGSLVVWHWGFDIVDVIARASGGQAQILHLADPKLGIEGACLEVIVQQRSNGQHHAARCDAAVADACAP